VVTTEVPINYEVISWVLGLGSAARVLLPASLKQGIIDELEMSVQGYGLESDVTRKVGAGRKARHQVS
jgi:hypothetical protein